MVDSQKITNKELFKFGVNVRVCSSVVERYVDIVEVISSILITPTKNINFLRQFNYLQKTLINIYPMSLVIIAKG